MAWDCRARVTSFLVVHALFSLSCLWAFQIEWQWSDLPASVTPDDVVVPAELSTYANIQQIAIRYPVLGQDSLIWCSTLGDVWAVTNLTNKPQLLWQKELGTALWGGARYGLRPGSPKGVVVVVDVDATVRVFDAEVGGSLWSAGVAGEASFTSPYLLGGSVFVATYNGTVRAHSITDGSVLWTSQLGVAVLADLWSNLSDTLYVLSTNGTLFALDCASGVSLWSLPLGAPSTFYSQIALQGDSIYVSLDGMLVCVDAPPGAQAGVSWSVPHAPGSVSITFLQLVPGSELLFAIHPQGFFMEVRLSDHAVLASDEIFTNYPSLTPSVPVVLNTANASCPFVPAAPPPPPSTQNSDQPPNLSQATPWSLSVYAADGRGTVRDLTAGDATLEEGALSQVAHAGLVWRDGLVFGVSHSAQVVALSVPGCPLPESLVADAPLGPVTESLNATLSPPRAPSGDLQIAWVVVVTVFAAIACVALALAVRWVSRRKATQCKAALSSDSAAGLPDAYPPDMFLGPAPSTSRSTSELSDSTSDSSVSSFRRVINLVPEQGMLHVFRSDVHPEWVVGMSEDNTAGLDASIKASNPSVWEWALNAASDPPPDAKPAAPEEAPAEPVLDSLGDTCFLPMMRTVSQHGSLPEHHNFAFDSACPASLPAMTPAFVPHAPAAETAISAPTAPVAPVVPAPDAGREHSTAWHAYRPSDSAGVQPDQSPAGALESDDSMPGNETGADIISSTVTIFSPFSSEESLRSRDGSQDAGSSAERRPAETPRSAAARQRRGLHDLLSPTQMLMYDEMEEPTETLNAQGQDDWSSSFGDFAELSSSLVASQLQRASTLPGLDSLKVALSMEYEGADVAASSRGSSAPLRPRPPTESVPDLQPVCLNDALVHDALQEAGRDEGPAKFV